MSRAITAAKLIGKILLRTLGKEAIKKGAEWIKDKLENDPEQEPATQPKPKPPVPTVPAPQGPVITPKPTPAPEKLPDDSVIMAFAQRDPDLQQLLGKYSHILNKHYANPINSPHNMQGQQFTRELETLIRRKFNV